RPFERDRTRRERADTGSLLRVRRGVLRVHGKPDPERGALALALAARLDRSAVQVDQLLHDREPEPEPAEAARRRRVGLAEAIEEMRQEVRADPDARIADLEHRM